MKVSGFYKANFFRQYLQSQCKCIRHTNNVLQSKVIQVFLLEKQSNWVADNSLLTVTISEKKVYITIRSSIDVYLANHFRIIQVSISGVVFFVLRDGWGRLCHFYTYFIKFVCSSCNLNKCLVVSKPKCDFSSYLFDRTKVFPSIDKKHPLT